MRGDGHRRTGGRWIIAIALVALLAGTDVGITPVATAQSNRYEDCIVHRPQANGVPDWTPASVIWRSPKQSLYGCQGWIFAMAIRQGRMVYGEWGPGSFSADQSGMISEWNASQRQWLVRIPDYMNHLITGHWDELERFWRGWFAQTGKSYFGPQVRIIVGQGQFCGIAADPSDSFYCSTDHTVRLGRRLLEQVLAEGGNLPPAIVLGHEWGHHIQLLLGIFNSYNSKGVEIQADCFAGVYAADMEQRGLLDVGDADNAVKLMFTIGDRGGLSPWFNPTAHGDGRERVVAFSVGVREGIPGCLKLR